VRGESEEVREAEAILNRDADRPVRAEAVAQPCEKRALHLPRTGHLPGACPERSRGALGDPFEHAVHDHEVETVTLEWDVEGISTDDIDVAISVLHQSPLDELTPPRIPFERDDAIEC